MVVKVLQKFPVVKKRQCSEEEATQSKCNSGRIRSEFLLHTEILMRKKKEKKNLWQNEISSSSETNLRRTKSRWGFSVRCRVSSELFATWLKPEAQTGRRRVSDCAAVLVQLAWDVRGNQSKQSNVWPPRPQWGDGTWERVGWGVGTILSRQEGGEGRGGEGLTNLCRRKNDFGRTFLKLCWMMIGWLPPLPFPVTDTDSRYTSFTYMTIFTLYWL